MFLIGLVGIVAVIALSAAFPIRAGDPADIADYHCGTLLVPRIYPDEEIQKLIGDAPELANRDCYEARRKRGGWVEGVAAVATAFVALGTANTLVRQRRAKECNTQPVPRI